MQYQIVTVHTDTVLYAITDLEQKVKQLIDLGWKPLGGSQVLKTPGSLYSYRAYQAMIKE